MHQRDFILRMIEQAGEAIRALRDRILGRRVDQQVVRETLGSFTGLRCLPIERLSAS